jgi:MFS family permease
MGRPKLLFATFMAGPMAQALVFTAFVAALPQIAESFGAHGEIIAQMAFTVASLGLMVGSLASGWVLDRAGTRVTLIGSAVIYGLAGAGGVVLGPTALLVSRFVVGVSAACMVTTCLWGITAEYAGKRRADVLGASSALANVISLVGTVIGGEIAQHAGWRLAFLQFPVYGSVVALLAYVSLRQVKPPRQASSAEMRSLLRLMPFYLLAALLFAVMFITGAQFPFILRLDGIVSSSARSLFIGGITFAGALASFAYGPLQRAVSRTGAFSLGLIAMATALVLVTLGAKPALAAVGAALMGLYVGLISPYLYHTVSEQADEKARGRAIGTLTAFCFLGAFLNPPMFAALAHRLGLRGELLLIAAVMIVIAVAALFRTRTRRRSVGCAEASTLLQRESTD